MTRRPGKTGMSRHGAAQPEASDTDSDRACKTPSAATTGPDNAQNDAGTTSTSAASRGVSRFPRCACTDTQCHGPAPHAPCANAARPDNSPADAPRTSTDHDRGAAGRTCTRRTPSTVVDSTYRSARDTLSDAVNGTSTSRPRLPIKGHVL